VRHLSAAGLLACVLAFTAVIVWLGQSSLEAPEPTGRSAFPAERAMATLKHLLQENRPHPAGTPENRLVRERIEKILQDAGYEPELQLAFQCNPEARAPGCTAVENVIAVHKGSKPGRAILVTAHYDSVPAGPGASDDGVGTAVVLELAREIARRKTENDFIFLITDGEETGLRGAYAFEQRHPLMKSVGLVINVEARGARGPSMMFETGSGNEALIGLFGQAIERPVANSFIYEIYRLLPNDTDFSVYRRAGIRGFNFAHSNAASLYHSQRDEIRFLDPNTLQHHGDNVFALAAALENADLEALRSDSDASYFDVFGRMLVSWPASLNLPLSGLALLALLGFALKQRHELGLGKVGLSLLAFLATPLLMFAAGWLLAYPLGVWPGAHPLDHPDPWAGRVATIAAAYGVAFVMATVAARFSSAALFLVSWILFALMSVALSWFLPGAAFFLLWPVVIASLLLWVAPMPVAALAGTAALAFFSLPYVSFVELVLGFGNTQFKILVIAPLCISLVSCLPMLAARWTWWPAPAMALVSAASALVAMQTPAYALDHPRGVNMLYYQDETPPPDWIATSLGAADDHSLHAQGFPSEESTFMLMNILPVQARVKPAADMQLAPPVFDQLKVTRTGSTTTVVGVLIPARSGYQVGLGIPADSGIRSIRVGDPILDSLSDPVVSLELVGAERLSQGKPFPVVINGIGGLRLPMEIVFDSARTPEFYVYERTALEAGPEADRLRAARPADAAPVHSGDASIVVQKVVLGKPLP
jgi:hypothetical protein